MPELPEVEALRRGLADVLPGLTVRSIDINKPKLVSAKGNVRIASRRKKEEFISELEGEKFTQVARRAKNLIFHFQSGKVLLVHLKMTGQFVYQDKNKNIVDGGHPIEESERRLPNKQTRIIFHLSRGTLFYNDTRQFGYLLYFPNLETLEKEGHFLDHGPEPLSEEFSLAYFRAALKKKKGVLKPVLMAQDVVVGLGNIYVDEVCFAAAVRPARKISTLKKGEIEALFAAIKKILPKAIALGGSSVSDHRLADGSRGNYAREHKVYGRSGKPCLTCNTKLKTTTVGGRTTVYCPHCQK